MIRLDSNMKRKCGLQLWIVSLDKGLLPIMIIADNVDKCG